MGLWADDWDDWGDEDSSESKVKRPFISGWWNWQYNEFSQFDQARVNLERDFDGGQKFFGGVNFNYYQEDNNKKWAVFAGENYYKVKAGSFDFKLGTLVENIGSGDQISFVDKINSRRFHNGLANDYNRDKKEVPAVKGTWYINKKFSLSGHYLPYFAASEFPNLHSKWAYGIHKSLAKEIAFNGTNYVQEDETDFKEQYHVEFAANFEKLELRFHYLNMKERLPVISMDKPGNITGTYPLDETIAMNGNFNLSKELLMRFEMAYTFDKTYSSFQDGRIGEKFYSDQFNFLLGTDKNLPNNFYINVQGMLSYVPDLKTETPFQLEKMEYLGTLQLRQNFKQDRLQIELRTVNNFTTGEYILLPKISVIKSDYLTFVLGYQMNGEASETLGPVGQFGENDTVFLETKVSF
jgi:hypothetical protein